MTRQPESVDPLVLARDALADGRHAIAAEHAATAAQDAPSPAGRAQALRLVVELNLMLERPHEALAWIEELRADAGGGDGADLLEAAAHLQLDDPLAALQLLAGTPPVDQAAATLLYDVRSRALLATGRIDESSADVRALLALDPRHTSGWQTLAVLCDTGGADPEPAVEGLPDEAVLDVLGALVGAPRDGADRIAQALWDRRPGDARVLAFLAVLGGELPLERALEWAARLRGHGAGDHCPLLGIAANEHRPGRERLRAAAVAAATFSDSRSEPLAELAITAVVDEELGAAIEELAALAPDLVDAAIVAAAVTPPRCLQLAGVAGAHGDERGAAALRRHALQLAGAG